MYIYIYIYVSYAYSIGLHYVTINELSLYVVYTLTICCHYILYTIIITDVCRDEPGLSFGARRTVSYYDASAT